MPKAVLHKNGRFIDMAGQAFGMLSVIDLAESRKNKSFWNCECTCGVRIQVAGNSLRTGNTKSCGCTRMQKFHAAARIATTKHGMYGTPVYRTWQSILARCDKPSHKSYKDYGGRGIKVCESWRDFSTFFADMGDRPLGTSIERIDNNKGYEVGNCEWKTAKHQARNRRNSRHITAFGETKLLVEWQEDPRCAVWGDTLSYRISQGWEIESAISTPPLRKIISKRGIKTECGLTKTNQSRDGCMVWIFAVK
jgi:hypothetical protein